MFRIKSALVKVGRVQTAEAQFVGEEGVKGVVGAMTQTGFRFLLFVFLVSDFI